LVLDRFGLEPCEIISELRCHDSHAIQIGIVLIYLAVGINPSISDCDASESYLLESFVFLNFQGKCWNIMSCKGLSGDVKGTLFELGPLDVEVIEEIEEVIRSLSC